MYVERPRGCYSDRPEHSPAKLPCYRAHGHLDTDSGAGGVAPTKERVQS